MWRTPYQTNTKLWLMFLMIQTFEVTIPTFTNIHSNIWPVFGLLLLVPGIILMPIFDLAVVWGIALAVPVNAAIWYFSMRSLSDQAESASTQRPSPD
jgi:hypothetical protein